MKKLFISVLILLQGSFVGIRAQDGGSAGAQIRVSVLPEVRVNKLTDVNFGIIAANSGMVSMEVSDESAGRFFISGTAGSEVSLDFIAPEFLLQESSHEVSNLHGVVNDPHRVRFIPQIAYSYHQNDGAVNWIDPEHRVPVRLSGETGDNTRGGVFISISGSLEIGNIPEGTYSGIFLLSAAYN
jgi:hypothetical protein